MDEYIPPKEWKKIDVLTALAPDGTRAWLDVRGLVGLTRPDGAYLSLGASLADTGDEPHGRGYSPPPEGSRICVFAEDNLTWRKDGRPTVEVVPSRLREIFLESIFTALSSVGYYLEFRKQS